MLLNTDLLVRSNDVQRTGRIELDNGAGVARLPVLTNTGATVAVSWADRGRLLLLSNARSNATVNLPDISDAFADGYYLTMRNEGTAAITINAAAGETIEGIGSYVLPPNASAFVVAQTIGPTWAVILLGSTAGAVRSIPSTQFADPAFPLASEVDTWYGVHGPFAAGTLVIYTGTGSVKQPDYSWHVDPSGQVIMLESPQRMPSTDDGNIIGLGSDGRPFAEAVISGGILPNGQIELISSDGVAVSIGTVPWPIMTQDPTTKELTIHYPDGTQSTFDTCCTTAVLQAEFMAGLGTGIAPLTVPFFDQSVGCTPDSWQWSTTDDDGLTWTQRSTIQNPTITFTTEGSYGVKLVAACSGAGLTDTETKLDYIVVSSNSSITTNFNISSTGGAAPLSTTLTDTSTFTGSCPPSSWLWELTSNGGSTWSVFSTQQHPTLNLTSAGTYGVRLTTACPAGLSDVETKLGLITVTTAASLIPDFTVGIALNTTPPTVNFHNATTTANGCTNNSWLWQYSLDGGATFTTFSTQQHPILQLPGYGTYTVRLTAGCSDGALTGVVTKTGLIQYSATAGVTFPACNGTRTCYRDLLTGQTPITWNTLIPNNTARTAVNSVNGLTLTDVMNSGVNFLVRGINQSTGAGGYGFSATSNPPDITFGVNSNENYAMRVEFSAPTSFAIDFQTLLTGELMRVTADVPIHYWRKSERNPGAVVTGDGTTEVLFDADPTPAGAGGLLTGLAGKFYVMGASFLEFFFTSDDATGNDNVKLAWTLLNQPFAYYSQCTDPAEVVDIHTNAVAAGGVGVDWEAVNCSTVPVTP